MRPRALVALLGLLGLTACRAEGRSAVRGSADPATPAGLADFAHSDFGALARAGFDRSLVPWKVAVVGLLQRAERRRGHALTRDSLPTILREYGFLDARRMRNWIGPATSATPPALGLILGDVPLGVPGLAVRAGGIGCAACHSSMLHDSLGRPSGDVWIGLPSSSIALGAYSTEVSEALEETMKAPDAMMARIRREFPGTGALERFALRRFVVPRARKRLAALRSAGGAPFPFNGGYPGHTNGLAALKYYLRPNDTTIDWGRERGFAAIPDLNARHLRSMMLVDGVYAPRGAVRGQQRAGDVTDAMAYLDSLAPIVAFFAIPALGVPPERAIKDIPRVRGVLNWFGTYRTPPFPAEIDTALAREGERLFVAYCASCHGTYARDGARPRAPLTYPNRVVPLAQVGTDTVRVALADEDTRLAIERTPFAPLLDASRTIGYLAPMLSGIWATAPYLHNGSVPSIWALLSPDDRPERFPMGGHALDYASLGLALERDADGAWRYPEGYVPWSRPAPFDSHSLGGSNEGHRFPEQGLTDPEKRRLIEYLKLL